jgi:hypothetical protein
LIAPIKRYCGSGRCTAPRPSPFALPRSGEETFSRRGCSRIAADLRFAASAIALRPAALMLRFLIAPEGKVN